MKNSHCRSLVTPSKEEQRLSERGDPGFFGWVLSPQTGVLIRKDEDTDRRQNGNPLQYSCLENPRDRGAWRAIVHRVLKSRT